MSKNPNLKAPYDSSPLCRVTLWLSLALLVLPSLQHGKAPTSSSSSDSPCPTPATLQAWAQVKASDFWSCSSWSEEGDFEPCLLVILPPFLSTLRLNPVYLLHRKLALSLSLLRAWLSGLYSTYCLTWQRPITMWNRSSQGRSCGLNGHGATSSQSYMGLLSFPSVFFVGCKLNDQPHLMCLFTHGSRHTFLWIPYTELFIVSNLLHFPLFPFSHVWR